MPTVNDVVVRKPNEQEIEKCKSWPIWSCPASEFEWQYDQTETCLIVEGQVTVTDGIDGGDSITFGPGDLVEFPVELQCVWKVTEPVKKHYNFS